MTVSELIECLQRAPEEVKCQAVFIYGFGDIQEVVVSKTERLDLEKVSWGITIKGKTQ